MIKSNFSFLSLQLPNKKDTVSTTANVSWEADIHTASTSFPESTEDASVLSVTSSTDKESVSLLSPRSVTVTSTVSLGLPTLSANFLPSEAETERLSVPADLDSRSATTRLPVRR